MYELIKDEKFKYIIKTLLDNAKDKKEIEFVYDMMPEIKDLALSLQPDEPKRVANILLRHLGEIANNYQIIREIKYENGKIKIVVDAETIFQEIILTSNIYDVHLYYYITEEPQIEVVLEFNLYKEQRIIFTASNLYEAMTQAKKKLKRVSVVY